MICKHCGSLNNANMKFCNICKCKLDDSEVRINSPKDRDDQSEDRDNPPKDRDNQSEDRDNSLEKEHDELNEGFSWSDANYISAKVINNQEDSHQLSNIEKQPSKSQRKTQRKIINRFKLSRKSWISISIILLIIMVSIIVLRRNSLDGEFNSVTKDAIEVYSDRANMVTYVFNTKGDTLQKLEQGVEPYYTTDHTAAILLGKNNSQSYYINSRELIKLNPGMRSFSMSENGKYIVYAVYSGINSYNLCLYDVEQHSEKVIDTIKDKEYAMINVLADGKTVTYLTVNFIIDTGDFIFESFILKIGEEPKTLGEGITVIEVSEDAEYIYYEEVQESGSYEVFVKSEAGGAVLLSDNITNVMYFNKDRTEIMFSDGETTYISVNGKERVKVTDTLLSDIIVPKKSIIRNNLSMRTYSYGIDTFKNKVILCNNNLRLIDDHYQSNSLGYVSDGQQVVMSEDGEDMIYLDLDKNLMKINNLTGKWGQELISEEINDTMISAGDLSQLYYLKDQQLYYRNNNEEPVMITDGVSSLCSNQAGDTVYFLKDYNQESGFLVLCYSKDGGEAKRLPDGYDVVGVKEWNYGVIYQKERNGIETVYYNTKGTKFKLLLEGVDFFERKIKYVD